MTDKLERSVSLVDGHIEEHDITNTKRVLLELKSASEWFAKHGRNTNSAIIGICERAIAEINRQQAENAELQHKNSELEADVKKLETIERISAKIIEKQDTEIERLNGLLIENEKAFNKMTELYNKAFNRCKTAKTEAIKEVTAELYNSFKQYENYDRHHTFEILERIESVEEFLLNNLVKEMTEVSE